MITLDILLEDNTRFSLYINHLNDLKTIFCRIIPKTAQVKVWDCGIQYTNDNLGTQYNQLVKDYN